MSKMIVCSGSTVDVEGAPEEIKILPLGLVHSQKGEFQVDAESSKLIEKQFKDRCLDLVVDYEHQTLKDMEAPAAAWIKDIYMGSDAIIAKVEWTPKAKEYLKNKEYRYLSPVVIVRRADQKAVAIHSVALTNTPAIDGMFAIVNSMDADNFNEEETIMELKELAVMLGLAETATESEVKAALADVQKTAGKKKQDGSTTGTKAEAGAETAGAMELVANSTVLSLLGLKPDAKTDDVAASIMALKSGDINVQTEILALKKKMEEKDADELVRMALKDGKITAAQNEWAKTYALTDASGFRAFLDKAPVVVPQGKMELTDAPGTAAAGYDTAILKNCGMPEEDVKKYFQEEN